MHPYSQTEGALQSHYNTHYLELIGAMEQKSSVPDGMLTCVVSF